MKVLRFFSPVFPAIAFALAFSADALGQTFAGQATAVKSTVTAIGQPRVTTSVADTSPLNGVGGTINRASAGVLIPSVLSVGNSTSTVDGSGNSTSSQSGVNSLNIAVAGITVTAAAVASQAQTTCPGSVRTASSTIASLALNGSSITVTGAPNQTVTVFFGATPIGTLVINEQVFVPGSVTVNALRLSVTDPFDSSAVDILVASARAGMNCAQPPPFNFLRGRAAGVDLTQSSILSGIVTTTISDTGALPTGGGSFSTTTTGAGLVPILTTGLVTASTSGGPAGGTSNSAQSATTVNNVSLTIGGALGVSISFDTLSANTQCTNSLGTVNCTGGSSITNLQVTALGFPVGISVSGLPNQTVTLPGGLGSLVINEQFGVQTGSPAEFTVNALRADLSVPSIADTALVFGSANSGLYAPSGTTAADASVGGRVTDANGRPIGGARVRITSATGFERSSMTSSFGYFNFDDVPVGEVYVVSVRSKRYRFEPRLLNLSDSVTDLSFTPSN